MKYYFRKPVPLFNENYSSIWVEEDTTMYGLIIYPIWVSNYPYSEFKKHKPTQLYANKQMKEKYADWWQYMEEISKAEAFIELL